MRGRTIVAITISLGFFRGCTSHGSQESPAAKEQYTRDFSCPAAQVQVTPRPELKPYDLTFGDTGRQAPDEIAKDPSALAAWEQKNAETIERFNALGAAVEAKGCDHDVIYICHHARTRASSDDIVQCEKAKHLPK